MQVNAAAQSSFSKQGVPANPCRQNVPTPRMTRQKPLQQASQHLGSTSGLHSVPGRSQVGGGLHVPVRHLPASLQGVSSATVRQRQNRTPHRQAKECGTRDDRPDRISAGARYRECDDCDGSGEHRDERRHHRDR